ncbi:hypothetical protein HRH25_12140 [Flavisolibacter sp. BT320]|nr:hypothetical protein [Flavisolibacter longurius]
MPFLPAEKEKFPLQKFWFMLPISLGMILVFILGFIDGVKGRFVIEGDRVWSQSVYGKKELYFSQIAGYRTDDKYVYILPQEKGQKRIKISQYYGGKGEILEWLSHRYPDLDEQKAERERQEILSNNELGLTVEQREEKLQGFRKRARLLNGAGAMVTGWIIFFPQPYEAAFWAALSLPPVCILASRFSGGFIRIQEEKGSAYPSVFWSLFFPSLGIAIRALSDFSIFAYEDAFKGALVITAIYLFLLFVRSKEFLFQSAKEYGIALFFGVLGFSYGYGVVVTLNCLYDKSPATVYASRVTDKRVSSGKSTTYYLTLTPWGPEKDTSDVAVDKELYHRVQNGEDVRILLRRGRLEIPWFIVTD